MKSVALVPYCPWPADTGGKVEMLKHLEGLRDLGPCTIISADTKPVGCGWTDLAHRAMKARGFSIVLREETQRLNARQFLGILYASVCKSLRLEKAFGHSNPYHRNAFPGDWWYRHTQSADLAVIHYSYWAWLPCACPKVIALLDIWSDTMWGGYRQEIKDLQTADLITVISSDEKAKLSDRGVYNTIWSPPAVSEIELPDSMHVGILGSPSLSNQEGLKWLGEGTEQININVYGGLSKYATSHIGFNPIGPYTDVMDPYRECGIILMTTALGMGVQIKGIEALAAGRAIVARRGAMRGIPDGQGAWIEVETPDQMMFEAKRLQSDTAARLEQMEAARAYYRVHLDAGKIRDALQDAYLSVLHSNAAKDEARNV